MPKFNITKRGLVVDKDIIEQKKSDIDYSYDLAYLSKEVEKIDDMFYERAMDELMWIDSIYNNQQYWGGLLYHGTTSDFIDEKPVRLIKQIERGNIKNI